MSVWNQMLVHKIELMNTDKTEEPKTVKFECFLCGDVSKTKNDQQKHRKKEGLLQRIAGCINMV